MEKIQSILNTDNEYGIEFYISEAKTDEGRMLLAFTLDGPAKRATTILSIEELHYLQELITRYRDYMIKNSPPAF